jgi:WhiB family redox-sensing transcriptional regulator
MSLKRWADRYVTVVGDTAWKDLAACRDDMQLFFGGDTLLAKQVCNGCPVRLPCLEFALTNNCDADVWGGLDPDERQAFKQRSMQ